MADRNWKGKALSLQARVDVLALENARLTARLKRREDQHDKVEATLAHAFDTRLETERARHQEEVCRLYDSLRGYSQCAAEHTVMRKLLEQLLTHHAADEWNDIADILTELKEKSDAGN